MSPRLALGIGAVAALVFGLALALAPGPMLGGFGLGAPTEGLILSRDLGVTLLGLAVINWLAKDAAGPAVRAILIGNLFVQAAELVVNAYELAAGMIPAQAAPGLVVHLALGALFGLALRRPSTLPERATT